LRIAFSTASPLGTAVDAEAAAAVQAAARRLAALGHHVEEAAPPVDGHAVAACYLKLYAAQVPAVTDQARSLGARDSEFEPLTRVMAAYGRRLDAAALTQSLARWNEFARTLGAFFGAWDVWLTPTTARAALPHGTLDPPPAEARMTDALLSSGLLAPLARAGALDTRVHRLFVQNLSPYPFTQLANLAGVPAMSLPLHWTPDGLPLGVQAVGRQGDEATLLQLAAELEADAPWFDRLAPIAHEAG
jgi:amidase